MWRRAASVRSSAAGAAWAGTCERPGQARQRSRELNPRNYQPSDERAGGKGVIGGSRGAAIVNSQGRKPAYAPGYRLTPQQQRTTDQGQTDTTMKVSIIGGGGLVGSCAGFAL